MLAGSKVGRVAVLTALAIASILIPIECRDINLNPKVSSAVAADYSGYTQKGEVNGYI